MPYSYMNSPKKEIPPKKKSDKDDSFEEKPLSIRDNFYAEQSDNSQFLAWLDLAYPHKPSNIIELMYKKDPALKEYHQTIKDETQKILDKTKANEDRLSTLAPKKKEKESRAMEYTVNKLKKYAAHAGFLSAPSGKTPVFKAGFKNLPGSLSNKTKFPGISLLNEKIREGLEEFSPEKLKTTKKWSPEINFGYYFIEDIEKYMSEIKKLYAESGQELHQVVERRIRNHIHDNNNILPKMAGIAGLHAEVQALNNLLSTSNIEGGVASKLSSSYIYTQRLVGAVNEDFPACHNCSGIINGLENVLTGRVKNHTRLTRRNSIA